MIEGVKTGSVVGRSASEVHGRRYWFRCGCELKAVELKPHGPGGVLRRVVVGGVFNLLA